MNLKEVFLAEGQLEAEMIKGFLEAQGLDVTLSQESIGRTYGLSVGPLGEVKVLVPESQVAEAIDFLDAMERGEYENDLPYDSSEET